MIARISTIALAMTLAAPAAGKPIAANVQWDQRRQPIDGFGGSSEFFTRNFGLMTPAMQRRVLEVLFDRTRGAGLSIVRSRIWDGACDGPPSRCALKPSPLTHHPAPGVWEFDCPAGEKSERCIPGKPKDHWQIWFAHQAKARAPDVKFMFSTWSAPGWMKDNGRPTEGGRLLVRHYPDYAEYLSRSVREYASRYGIRAEVISVQNEPTYGRGIGAAMMWSPEEMRVFVRDHLGPRLAADKVTAKIMVAEDEHWDQQTAKATLTDPAAARYIGIFGSHAYKRGTPFGGAAGPVDLGLRPDLHIWQTELCSHWAGTPFDPSIDDGLGWAASIHDFMTKANASAWLYWMLQSPAGDDTPVWKDKGKMSLIAYIPEFKRLTLTKRLWAMGNYSRFVRPGFVRVAATAEPAPGVHLSAYRNAASNLAPADAGVIVAINEGRAAVALAAPAGFVLKTVHRTSASEDLSVVPGAPRFVLAPRSITTFVGSLRAPARPVTGDDR